MRERLGIDDVTLVLQQNRLRWYGHVLWKEDTAWVKKCMEYEVEGSRPKGRLGERLCKKDCQVHNLNREDAMVRSRWKKQINVGWWSGWLVGECTGSPGIPDSPGQRVRKMVVVVVVGSIFVYNAVDLAHNITWFVFDSWDMLQWRHS